MKTWIILFGLLVVIGCSEHPVLDIKQCTSDLLCVPKPGCHPMECINSDFIDQFEQPDFCTEEFRFDAAYNADDCLCTDGMCVNKNLGRTAEEEEEEEEEEERNHCTESMRDADSCVQVYQPVCGWFKDSVQCIRFPCAADYSNSCFACMDQNVEYYTDGACPIDCPGAIDYDEALDLLFQGRVESVMQAHSLCVTFTLEDGTTVKTIEPEIDQIFEDIEQCETCDDLILATE